MSILGGRTKVLHCTALRAAYNRHVNVVRLLLSFDTVDVNACDKNQSTPLHYAAFRGHADAVRMFLSCGRSSHVSEL